MTSRLLSWVLAIILGVAVALGGGGLSVQAANNPDLLPSEQTPVIDLARALTDSQKQQLAAELEALEADTGWKLRVLTQYDRTPGRALKDYWGLDEKSLLFIADPRGGNLLNFNVGGDYYRIFPRTYWIELQTRFGNQYYVRDHGEDGSILDAVASLSGCLRQGGCSVVPGLPREQWLLTLATSIVGGLICGLAAHPRKPGQIIAWQWMLIFSPLWGMLFIAFGLGPVVTRTSEWLPVFRNVSGFLIGALAAYLSFSFRETYSSES